MPRDLDGSSEDAKGRDLVSTRYGARTCRWRDALVASVRGVVDAGVGYICLAHDRARLRIQPMTLRRKAVAIACVLELPLFALFVMESRHGLGYMSWYHIVPLTVLSFIWYSLFGHGRPGFGSVHLWWGFFGVGCLRNPGGRDGAYRLVGPQTMRTGAIVFGCVHCCG